MGVINITPNSFSDGGELATSSDLSSRLEKFGNIEAIDIGAESTAPMNESINWGTEWERIKPHLPLIKAFKGILSFDTYHPETINEVVKFYTDHKMDQELFWNDVSGKFDDHVKDFLSQSPKYSYVLCHNLAPRRELSGKHMEYIDPELSIKKLEAYFFPYKHSQVVFDPCLGFSKTYEQNWMILENFGRLQELCAHNRWLIGFSRKSFLRKKLGLDLQDKEKLDFEHVRILNTLKQNWDDEVWIRTHRPDLLS